MDHYLGGINLKRGCSCDEGVDRHLLDLQTLDIQITEHTCKYFVLVDNRLLLIPSDIPKWKKCLCVSVVSKQLRMFLVQLSTCRKRRRNLTRACRVIATSAQRKSNTCH